MTTFTSAKALNEPTVLVEFEGEPVRVPAGLTVAAALLGHTDAGAFCSNSADGSERAPHCLMGVCFESLVEIDVIPNRQACLTPVAEGMVIRRHRNLTDWII